MKKQTTLNNLIWVKEKLYPDLHLGLRGRLLFKKKTPYQNMEVISSPFFGNILFLDGVVQTTEGDEFIYHEMITHPAILTHPRPKNVLIVGGGDGGVLREVLKHKTIKNVYLVEIDNQVIEIAKKYFSSIHKNSFSNPRLKLIIDDGAKYLSVCQEKFDIIIIDSPDPIGAAEVLFSEKFYQDAFSHLTSSGIMIRQTGSTFLQARELKENYSLLKKIFPFVAVELCAIPTYIGGFFSLTLASKKINPYKVSREKLMNRYKKLKLNTKYYNPDIHLASLKLPNYVKNLCQ